MTFYAFLMAISNVIMFVVLLMMPHDSNAPDSGFLAFVTAIVFIQALAACVIAAARILDEYA